VAVSSPVWPSLEAHHHARASRLVRCVGQGSFLSWPTSPPSPRPAPAAPLPGLISPISPAAPLPWPLHGSPVDPADAPLPLSRTSTGRDGEERSRWPGGCLPTSTRRSHGTRSKGNSSCYKFRSARRRLPPPGRPRTEQRFSVLIQRTGGAEGSSMVVLFEMNRKVQVE
jgi:hypothetical protein